MKSILFLVVTAFSIFSCKSSIAQIVPDESLPNPSQIDRIDNTLRIQGGTEAGTNLFHSFSEFNVRTGETAHFNNATTVENILTRVTGDNISNIDGLVRANGTANLYLINPNGLIFGENARLDIGGSFFATSAAGLTFPDGLTYSTTAPESTPLLSVNVPLGVQYGASPGDIDVRSTALNVPQNLVLLGGNLRLQGTQLHTPSGNVVLGGLVDSGVVEFEAYEFPETIDRGDLSLNQSQIEVVAGGGGDITLRARNVELTDAQMQAGIAENAGALGAQAGNIDIDATGIVLLTEQSSIENRLLPNTVGVGGNIDIKAASLTVRDSTIDVSTESAGNAGNLFVTSNVIDIGLVDRTPIPNTEDSRDNDTDNVLAGAIGLFSLVFGSGDGGRIKLNSPDIRLNDRVQISSETFGEGSGGSIDIQTDRLFAEGGARISTASRGAGDAGPLTVNATESVTLDGLATNFPPGGLSASAATASTGNGSRLMLTTRNLFVRGGAAISSVTAGSGNGGAVEIYVTETLEISGRAPQGSNLFQGGGISSGIFAAVRPRGEGIGGDIEIETARLRLLDSGSIDAGTRGEGDGGSIRIRATESIELASPSELLPSRISAQVERGGTRNSQSGNIAIETPRLVLRDGGQISVGTLTEGSGRSIEIHATESIDLSGSIPQTENARNAVLDSTGQRIPSGIFAVSQGTGNAGSLTIETSNLNVRDGAQVSVSSVLAGETGNLELSSDRLFLSHGMLSAQSVEGDKASIFIHADSIELRRGSRITTNATGAAGGGNIDITADTLIASDNSDITANAQQNAGGQVRIDSNAVLGIAARATPTDRSDITASSELGAAFEGVVELSELDIDTNGLFQLVEHPQDISRLVVDRCHALRAGSEFVVTGRGGLPQDPVEPIHPMLLWADTRSIDRSENTSISSAPEREPSTPLLEATGWITNESGSIELVRPERPVDFPTPACRRFQP